eukprot:SM000045S16238  [mRNA]  locus=s45:385536:387563:+ [translate_table: standard]
MGLLPASSPDALNALLNVTLLPLALLLLAFAWPVLAAMRALSWVVRRNRQVANRVVVITGASSGIGEHLAYAYAKRGAKLVLAARREEDLKNVAQQCWLKGSPEAVSFASDVAIEDDCKKLIDFTIAHFKRLDVLVLNAGISNAFLFEDAENCGAFKPVWDTIYWGAVLPTFYALPHLRRVKGQILITNSIVSFVPIPAQNIYNASKAAVLQHFDTMRCEPVGADITITQAMPGPIATELTAGKFVDEKGEMVVDTGRRDAVIGPLPMAKPETCAEVMFQAAIHNKHYVIIPNWFSTLLLYRILAPELMFLQMRSMLMTRRLEGKPASQLIMEAVPKELFYDTPAVKPEEQMKPSALQEARKEKAK